MTRRRHHHRSRKAIAAEPQPRATRRDAASGTRNAKKRNGWVYGIGVCRHSEFAGESSARPRQLTCSTSAASAPCPYWVAAAISLCGTGSAHLAGLRVRVKRRIRMLCYLSACRSDLISIGTRRRSASSSRAPVSLSTRLRHEGRPRPSAVLLSRLKGSQFACSATCRRQRRSCRSPASMRPPACPRGQCALNPHPYFNRCSRRHREGILRARGGVVLHYGDGVVDGYRGVEARRGGGRRRGRRRRRRRRARPREVGWSVRGKPRGLSWETTTRRTPSSRDTDERRRRARRETRPRARCQADNPPERFLPKCSFSRPRLLALSRRPPPAASAASAAAPAVIPPRPGGLDRASHPRPPRGRSTRARRWRRRRPPPPLLGFSYSRARRDDAPSTDGPVRGLSAPAAMRCRAGRSPGVRPKSPRNCPRARKRARAGCASRRRRGRRRRTKTAAASAAAVHQRPAASAAAGLHLRQQVLHQRRLLGLLTLTCISKKPTPPRFHSGMDGCSRRSPSAAGAAATSGTRPRPVRDDRALVGGFGGGRCQGSRVEAR